MKNNKYVRRNYFVKKNFQGKLILGYFLLMMGGGLLFMATFAAFSADSLTIVSRDYDLQVGQTPLMLLRNGLMAHWVFVVIGGSLLLVATIFITHRIAGPQFRFEKALDSMIGGRLDDVIHLRDKDEGGELAVKMNHFNAELSRKIGAIDKNIKSAEALLEKISVCDPATVDPDELDVLCKAIRQHNAEISKITNTFTLLNE